MKNYLFLPALLLLLLNSCATMKVKVSIINQEKLKEMPGARAALVEKLDADVRANLKNDLYNAERAKLKIEVNDIIQQMVQDGITDTVTATNLLAGLYSTIDSGYKNAIDLYNTGLVCVQKAADSSQYNSIYRKYLVEAQTCFLGGDNQLLFMRNQIESGLRVTLPPGSMGNPAEIVLPKTSLLHDGLLLGDPLVSFVVKTRNQKKYWKGVYNKTVTRNGFGNSDVAIAMETLGDFTIKGVRLDATTVVAATFKSLSTGIKLLSNYSGVALPKAAAGENTTDEQPMYGQVIEKKLEQERNSILSKKAAFSIMEAIVSRRTAISDPALVGEKVREIQQVYTIYKPLLKQ
jgi:hypothetical protein